MERKTEKNFARSMFKSKVNEMSFRGLRKKLKDRYEKLMREKKQKIRLEKKRILKKEK